MPHASFLERKILKTRKYGGGDDRRFGFKTRVIGYERPMFRQIRLKN